MPRIIQMNLKLTKLLLLWSLAFLMSSQLSAGTHDVCRSLFAKESFRPQEMQVNTERIVIRFLNESDDSVYGEVLQSEKIKKMANDRAWANFTPKQVKQNFLESLKDSSDPRSGSYVLTIIDRATNGRVGFIYLSLSEDGSHEAEIAYEILPQFWGKKFASEAVGAVLPLCRQFGVRRMIAKVAASNEGSARVLEKNGFQLDSTEMPTDQASIYRNEPDSVYIKKL